MRPGSPSSTVGPPPTPAGGPAGTETQDVARVRAAPVTVKEAVRDVARGQAFAAGGDVVVHVCYGAGCTGDTDADGATNVRGTPVTVTVISNVGLMTGALAGWPAFSLSSSSTMLVNH
jgi:lipid-binding SYLF domain-containing protein